MLNGIVFNKFLNFFPVLDFEKLLSWLKAGKPASPDKRHTLWIAPGATGAVYITPEGKVVFWPAHADGLVKDISEARYLLAPPSAIFIRPIQCQVFLVKEKLGPLDEANPVSLRDKRLTICYLYGAKRAPAILARFELD